MADEFSRQQHSSRRSVVKTEHLCDEGTWLPLHLMSSLFHRGLFLCLSCLDCPRLHSQQSLEGWPRTWSLFFATSYSLAGCPESHLRTKGSQMNDKHKFTCELCPVYGENTSMCLQCYEPLSVTRCQALSWCIWEFALDHLALVFLLREECVLH